MSTRVARGSLSGRWSPRGDGAPNLTGAVTIERDLPKGTKLWLSAWTRAATGCDEFLSTFTRARDADKQLECHTTVTRLRTARGQEDRRP